jgi:3-isopropylmalate dehydrogenase
MKVVVLPGDCIGPEVAAEAVRVLRELAPEVELEEHLLGAAAIRATGDPLPDETLAACKAADAVLKAPVGDPEFDAADVRPEQGIFRIREGLAIYANLRPATQGDVDLLIVRELVGGLYFGARGVRDDGTVFDTCEYHPREVERIARRAFELARRRRGKLTSVDKANVLDTSRMWRRVVHEVAADYPDVDVEDMLVDNAAMQLASKPQQFDVIVTENMFGDILSDLAAAMTGGLGLAPSASLGDSGPGLFEPVHGSAPDIAGKGVANPAAMLRSTDLGGTASTSEFTDAVLAALTDARAARTL